MWRELATYLSPLFSKLWVLFWQQLLRSPPCCLYNTNSKAFVVCVFPPRAFNSPHSHGNMPHGMLCLCWKTWRCCCRLFLSKVCAGAGATACGSATESGGASRRVSADCDRGRSATELAAVLLVAAAVVTVNCRCYLPSCRFCFWGLGFCSSAVSCTHQSARPENARYFYFASARNVHRERGIQGGESTALAPPSSPTMQTRHPMEIDVEHTLAHLHTHTHSHAHFHTHTHKSSGRPSASDNTQCT